ncbi:aldose epimerase family protein [Candidatus Neomarinimicrobiota bacterium]
MKFPLFSTNLVSISYICLFSVLAIGCTASKTKEDIIMKANFGQIEGASVDVYTLTNANGCELKITNYGCIIVSLKVPDKNGQLSDVVLGYDTLDEYIANNPYFGAVVGRYGNRIGAAKFTLDNVEYKLAVNDGENHLHGGLKGFDKVLWAGAEFSSEEGPAVKFSYLSPDGEEGYPGNLKAEITYTLTNDNELKIDYRATTDKKTVINLTHHSYFNLAGAGNGDILGHKMTIKADHFIPIDKGLIPTGELQPVDGTPLDFRVATAIGERIDQGTEQLEFGGGYDHCWVLVKSSEKAFERGVEVHEPVSGRVMELLTTEPSVQFYSGNFLDGSNIGKGGKAYNYRTAIALEAQHYPDSPNQPQFPSVVLEPGQEYSKSTVYRFSVK